MRRLWNSRSLRLRIVLSSSALVLVALVIGTVALAALFTAGRIRDIDQQTRAEADTLTALVSTGQLPSVLPVPAGSSVLAQVLRADGTVLAASPAASRTQPLAPTERAADDVGTDEQGGYAGTPLRHRIVHLVADGQPLTLVVAAPLGDVRRAISALRAVLLVVVPLLVLGAGAVVWWVAGRALRPVDRLRAAAEAVARGPSSATDFKQLPVPAGDDELARLGRTLNAMLAGRQRALQQQADFVTAAAHELRSPLGSLQVQIEVAAAHPDLVDLPQFLDDLRQDIARLTSLADDLLALAQLDAHASFHPQTLDLTALAGASGPPVMVAGDEDALRRLIDNLLVNARRHAAVVQVSTIVEEDWAVLVVDDDGPGVPAADRERIFDRWVRLDTSRSRDRGGFGLGLAIVRDIARAHGGDVTVLDSPLGGARVRLRLPRAD